MNDTVVNQKIEDIVWWQMSSDRGDPNLAVWSNLEHLSWPIGKVHIGFLIYPAQRKYGQSGFQII
jgi:hypothetical protein